MYNVDPCAVSLVKANSAVEAVHKFITKEEKVTYYNVWKTTGEFFVVYHNPEGDKRPEVEYTISAKGRKKLQQSMMHHAECDRSSLQQICEMASTLITDRESYNNWIGERDEYDD